MSGSFELPHNYKEGSDLRPHIHFTTKDGGSGDVKWNIEYTISNINESFGNAVTINGVQSVQATPVLKCLAVETDIIDGLLLHIGAQCYFRLFRDPTDAEDTYSGDALLSSIGIHYEIDGDGSRDIFTK